MRTRTIDAALLATAAAIFSSPAAAQPGGETEEAFARAEIIVTATKRAEPVREMPSAFSPEVTRSFIRYCGLLEAPEPPVR